MRGKQPQEGAQDSQIGKDARVEFRLTSEEKKRLQQKAKQAGKKSLGAYLIAAGLEQPLSEPIPPELRRHLVGIGTNLNQLARLANSGKAFAEFPQYEQALKQTLDVLNRAITGEPTMRKHDSKD